MRNPDGTFSLGNPGRPRGVENKSSAERKQKLKELVQAIESDHLEEDLKKLSPRDRVRLYLAAHEYLVPKLGRIEHQELTEVEELISLTPEERQAKIIESKKNLRSLEAKKDLEKRLQLLEMLEEKKPLNLDLLTVRELYVMLDYVRRRNNKELCPHDNERIEKMLIASQKRNRRRVQCSTPADSFADEKQLEVALTKLNLIDLKRYHYNMYPNQKLLLYMAERVLNGDACQCEIERLKNNVEKFIKHERQQNRP